ncbi:phage terminase large subunit family protein [Serratia sp. MF2]|uniref:phage terminase large subunit family protein n=1 Tax=Serratia sp. MF1(2023) TaxID=3059171 RepID=UPI0027F95FD4|nr:phage terminase large subunit family protein [Serratia sp. MF1(2023)]MDQ7104197.1 phage terminase large subunit family protein [Serratia sp. MF1(2023)]
MFSADLSIEGISRLSTLSVSEWADSFRILPQSGSSEPGPWRTSRTPYLKGIMDELSASCPTREIVFAKGSQIGASEAGTNWLMYLIDQQPGPLLALQPTELTAMRWSKQRIGPSLLQCKKLDNKLQKNNGNTLLQKDFVNGTLILSGANSPASLASMPISAIYFDEVDRYPISAGDEGDPIGLALRRTATFPNAKIYYSSTPTLLEISRVWDLWENSDKRRYMVPCPHCDERQALEFESMTWTPGEPDSAAMVCIHCGCLMEEHHKRTMLSNGVWIAENPKHWRAGFHLSSLYSPAGWMPWADVVRAFEAAEGKPEEMKVFTNTILGLPWEETGEALAAEYFEKRKEYYNGEVPNDVLMLTLAADTQHDRIEYEVCGWGVDEESWGIKYGVIYGDMSQLVGRDVSNPTPWEQLDLIRRQIYRREDGREMRIAITLVDSGGKFTDTVYKYTKAREKLRVFSIKGGSVADRPLLSKPTRNNKEKAALFVLGVGKGKSLVYHRLKIQKPGAGFCHYPKDESSGYDPLYYSGLTNEKLVKRRVNGKTVLRWEKPKDKPNEPFDIRVYGTAAIRILNPKWEQLAKIPKPKRPEVPKKVESENKLPQPSWNPPAKK